MKQNLLIIIWTFLPLFTIGQTLELKGTVIDSASQVGFPRASLELIKNDSTLITTETDFEGLFKIENLRRGVYRLKVRAISYHDLEVIELNLTNESNELKIELTNPIELEPAEINWGEGHILIEDSLGNTFCIDGSKNKVDSVGLRQGAWVRYFMDHSHTISGYRIGQKLWEGKYQNDLKQGEWRSNEWQAHLV